MEGRRENAVPIFQYVDWGYADDGTLRRRNSQTAIAHVAEFWS